MKMKPRIRKNKILERRLHIGYNEKTYALMLCDECYDKAWKKADSIRDKSTNYEYKSAINKKPRVWLSTQNREQIKSATCDFCTGFYKFEDFV